MLQMAAFEIFQEVLFCVLYPGINLPPTVDQIALG